ncbi:MAG: hypothetical protein RM021_023555 [Nostoc sp. EkiNYC01]|nr:hypothetical protein [Nostoc sp. EkiNYC01]
MGIAINLVFDKVRIASNHQQVTPFLHVLGHGVQLLNPLPDRPTEFFI